jgi:ABC-type nitrate/sulfonate/bicarbonate transport system substrate-binding protein
MLTSRRPSTRTGALLAALAATALGASACGAAANANPSPAAQQVKVLRYQGSANTVTLPELAADLGYLGDLKLKWVGNTISGPQDIQSAATGQTDFGGAFDGAIVKLQSAGAPITSVVSYYGADDKTFQGYFVLDGSSIRSARDLIGKKVGVNTLGAHLEAVLDNYLKAGGLTDKEVDSVQLVVVPPLNAETALRKKQIDVAVLSGVLQDTAVAHGGLRLLFSDYQALGAFNGGSYVFTKRFLAKNPATVRTFVAGVAKAIEWSKTTPRAQVIAELTKVIQGRGRDESTANLKYWKSYGIAAKGGLITDADFTRWFDWLQTRGKVDTGKLAVKDLYTNAFNPYAS